MDRLPALAETRSYPLNGHSNLHHRGKEREVDDDKGRTIELDCITCGRMLGPWQDR